MSLRLPIVCRVRTQRLLLRAFKPSDAPALCELIAGNLEFLRRWMVWAWQEPTTVKAKRTWLGSLRRSMLAGGTAGYGVFTPDESTVMGAIGTHPRIGAGAREIGYWMGEQHLRRGYASEAAAALTKVGFELQRLRRMEIHTDPENTASVGVARRTGFHQQIIIRRCVLSQASPVRDSAVWAMTSRQYAESFAARSPIAACDCRGGRLRSS